jgi:hypothetical protein
VDDIHFIGVWDTVGALGIPAQLPGWEEMSKRTTGWEQLWGFHDTQLSSHVSFAYQALAIDEQREAFKPTLWTQDAAGKGQTLEQVWFAGVHTEAGGGSRDAGLSDIALLWMVERATDCGLVFKPDHLEVGGPDEVGGVITPNYGAKIVDSRTGFWAAMHPYHRLKELPVGDAPGQSIASSSDRRLREGVDRYSPPGLRDYLDVLKVTDVDEGPPASG